LRFPAREFASVKGQTDLTSNYYLKLLRDAKINTSLKSVCWSYVSFTVTFNGTKLYCAIDTFCCRRAAFQPRRYMAVTEGEMDSSSASLPPSTLLAPGRMQDEGGRVSMGARGAHGASVDFLSKMIWRFLM
jgi:hypothetical protein